MPRCARAACWRGVTAAAVAAGLVGCAVTPEPVTIREPQEVLVEVPVPCPAPETRPTKGNDLAPAGADIFEAARHARARIIDLRREVDGLRAWAEGCATEE